VKSFLKNQRFFSLGLVTFLIAQKGNRKSAPSKQSQSC